MQFLFATNRFLDNLSTEVGTFHGSKCFGLGAHYENVIFLNSMDGKGLGRRVFHVGVLSIFGCMVNEI